jgi:hypothetical protein
VPLENETMWQKIFQFSHCEFSIYMWQHSSSTCIAYWLDIHELVFSIRNFLIENCDYHFETITVAIMAWVAVTEYLCHTWHRISFFVALTVPRQILSTNMTCHRIFNMCNTKVPSMKQNLVNLPQYLIFVGPKFLDFYVMFCGPLFVLLYFFF